mgnify:CR=1 FL=1
MCAKPKWKEVYPFIKTAIHPLEMPEDWLSQVVSQIARVYQADCAIYSGVAPDAEVAATAYGTEGFWAEVATFAEAIAPPQPLPTLPEAEQPTVKAFQLHTLPDWLTTQQQKPYPVSDATTGTLTIPIMLGAAGMTTGKPAKAGAGLQLVLQLRRSPHVSAQEVAWTPDEMMALEVICSQLVIAYQSMDWRRQIGQIRRQASLVGRVAQLINSSLNPDEVVERIIAELGHGLRSDRCILLDLRDQPVHILTLWDEVDQTLPPLPEFVDDQASWAEVVESFWQGGASHLQVEVTTALDNELQGWLKQMGATSLLLVPLMIQAELFGAIALLSYQQPRRYQLDELQTVRQVADQVAIALINAQHYQGMWHRQESRRIQSSPLQQDVLQDKLTQLLNRRALENELEHLSSRSLRAVQSSFCILICDIDYFKLVNDTYGHLIGDEVLRVLAQRLQRQLRRDTPLYRYGGEEFMVILMDTELKKAVDVAERLRYEVQSQPVRTQAGAVAVTVSFGVAQYQPQKDQNAWDIVHRADQALQEAKRQGRDRIKAL